MRQFEQNVTPFDLLRDLVAHADGGADADDALTQVQAAVDRFTLEYRCAMAEIATKIDILRRDFELTHDYSPIEHVNTRVKSLESLAAKVNRLGCPPKLEAIREQIRDIAGIRVTCAFVEDTYRIAEMLTRQPDIQLLETKDYIANPKPNGYQSLHLIVALPIYLSDRSVRVPVEVQIRTIAMDFWASVEHRIYYKYAGAIPEQLSENLRQVALTAADLDKQMAQMRDEVQSLSGEADPAKAPRPRGDAES